MLSFENIQVARELWCSRLESVNNGIEADDLIELANVYGQQMERRLNHAALTQAFLN